MVFLEIPVTMRGDSAYCPLPLSLDTYGNCETDCLHCYFRRLNHIWGKDLKPARMEAIKKQLTPGPRAKNPVTMAVRMNKTIKIGNKTDPYQAPEKALKITRKALFFLTQRRISFVIQTRSTELLLRDIDLLKDYKDLVTIMPVITAGLERDWVTFERKRTTHPLKRLEHVQYLKDMGFNVGINGEPFIPGFHTVTEAENLLKMISQIGTSWNTYNFHENEFVYKRMAKLPGVDIVHIWEQNKDEHWKGYLKEIIRISKDLGVTLGCPDFINSGDYVEKSNTCCGINVPNPFKFNAVNFKKRFLNGMSKESILSECWEGIGDYEEGETLFKKNQKIYTLEDIRYE